MAKRLTKTTKPPLESGQKDCDKLIKPPKKNLHLTISLADLKTITPLTQNQNKFFQLYDQGEIFVALQGVAGSGKTLIALYKAIQEVLSSNKLIKNVIVVRSAVNARPLGHLPGDLEEKLEVYEQPYKQICTTLFARSDAWDRLNEQGKIKFISSSFLRGLTFDNAVIIVDECQSLSWHELNSIITRVGDNSKIIFVGDLKQNDLILSKNDVSGLGQFLRVARTLKDFKEIVFNVNDIVRSGLVKDWILACDSLNV